METHFQGLFEELISENCFEKSTNSISKFLKNKIKKGKGDILDTRLAHCRPAPTYRGGAGSIDMQKNPHLIPTFCTNLPLCIDVLPSPCASSRRALQKQALPRIQKSSCAVRLVVDAKPPHLQLEISRQFASKRDNGTGRGKLDFIERVKKKEIDSQTNELEDAER